MPSGRKPKSVNRAQTEMIIAETSPNAAGYLRDIANGGVKADPVRVDVCKYLINQEIGAPRQRAEINNTGEVSFVFRYTPADPELPAGVSTPDCQDTNPTK